MNKWVGFVRKEGDMMVPVVEDRRVQKTRALLKNALIALIAEKGFESVTIQEILDRANVGRSTFYIHFENKQELLHACFEDFRRLFEEHNMNIVSGGKRAGDLDPSAFIQNLFRLIARNHRLFKVVLGKEAILSFSRILEDYVFSYVSEAIRMVAENRRDPLQMEILAHYLTNAFIGTLKWWVEKDMPCSAEELEKSFEMFSFYDIRQVLGR